MVDDIDIYRSAKLLTDRHGRDAVIKAAMRAAALLDAGDCLKLVKLLLTIVLRPCLVVTLLD